MFLVSGGNNSEDDLQSLEFTKHVMMEHEMNSLDKDLDDGEYSYTSSPSPYPSRKCFSLKSLLARNEPHPINDPTRSYRIKVQYRQEKNKDRKKESIIMLT